MEKVITEGMAQDKLEKLGGKIDILGVHA